MTSDDATVLRKRSLPATDLALISGCAALIAVCALLPAIHVGSGVVPITLQTFGVLLAGAILGSRRGFLAVILYIAVGVVGIPVFAGGASGLAVFTGPTVGYLVGFPFAAAACGCMVERLPKTAAAANVPLVFLAGIVASALFIHTLGIAGMAWRIPTSLSAAWRIDWVFWPGDIAKNLLMAMVATAVHRAFPDILPARTAMSIRRRR